MMRRRVGCRRLRHLAGLSAGAVDPFRVDRRPRPLLRCERPGRERAGKPMTTESAAAQPAAAVRVGELTIDPETGEVVGGSAGPGDEQIAYLARICAEAQQAMREQEATYNAARAALQRLLVESGRRSVITAHGTPTLRDQTRRSARPDRVVETVRRHELSREQEQLIWMTATALDAKELDALAEAGALPADAVADLIETKQISFLQLVPTRGDESRPR